MAILLPRSTYCYDQFGNVVSNSNCSGWSNWGRWVALGLIIAFFLLMFIACSCFTSRRRRARGRNPYWGTGWAAQGNYPNNQYNQPPPREQQHYAYESNNAQAPPYYSRNDQQTGIEMPARPDNAYAPPTGPPPAKY